MGLIELKLSEEITAGPSGEVCDSEIVLTQWFNVVSFTAECAFDANLVARLVWDFGGGSEETLWSIKGSGKMNFIQRRRDGNGVKKIALCLNNTLLDGSKAFMSGRILIKTIGKNV